MVSSSELSVNSIQTFEFVVRECARIHSDLCDAIAQKRSPRLAQRDALAFLPDYRGSGHITCGGDAYDRLHVLAVDALSQSPHARAVDPKDVFQALRQITSSRFVSGAEEVTIASATNALAAALDDAIAKCANSTHYIPCRLMWTSQPGVFAIGPVTFRSLSNFKETLAPAFEDYRKQRDTGQLKKALNYYDGFGWVAEVKILECAPTIARQRAERAVKAAVNVLSLLFGAFRTRKMAVGGYKLPDDPRAHSKGSSSAVGFEEDWAKLLQRDDIQGLLDGVNHAFASIVDPALLHPLSERFVEAMSWFGEAMREAAPGARIVKAITAAERLVMTGKPSKKQQGRRNANIKEVFAHRAAAVRRYVDGAPPFKEILGDFYRFYTLRSELAHGERSPLDPSIESSAIACLAIVEQTLLAALVMFHEQGVLDRALTSEDLSAGYDVLVQDAVAED
jgi:hypothetical protein